MRSSVQYLALLAVAASARPAPWMSWGSGPSSTYTNAPTPTWTSSPLLPAPSSFPTGANGDGTPFSFPLSNGFPNISIGSAALAAIQAAAHGTLPNTPLPTEISSTSATVLQVIAFNEIFEVGFFTELLSNITNNVPGYEIGSSAAETIILDALIAVQAQEQLHAIGANAILTTANQTAIQPCQYDFPVDSFDSAIEFASTFTDVVLGTLQEALYAFSADGDGADFLKLVGSIIGQEGEQNGVYRVLSQVGKIPSALPFLTQSAGIFAYSALNQLVVVPGSCPNANVIDVPILPALTIATPDISAATTSLDFSIAAASAPTGAFNVVYVNQQNVPVVTPATNVVTSGSVVTFSASFPYTQYELNGLTIAAVTNSTGPFANATQVAESALYGPGLIEIN